MNSRASWTLPLPLPRSFPGGWVVKTPPTKAGNSGWMPGSEAPLEEEVATHSSILAWRIPGTEKPGGLHSLGSQSGTDRAQAGWLAPPPQTQRE